MSPIPAGQDRLIDNFVPHDNSVERNESTTLNWKIPKAGSISALSLSWGPEHRGECALPLTAESHETPPLARSTVFILAATPTGGGDPTRLTATVGVNNADLTFHHLTVKDHLHLPPAIH
ncbi:hypothetical protein [Streptomyces sp. S186]|uniref:hypothetical protein n=1 Tax=Streptomyces sp. S186 TaxID=3434395 RepID=UPI003F6635D5